MQEEEKRTVLFRFVLVFVMNNNLSIKIDLNF